MNDTTFILVHHQRVFFNEPFGGVVPGPHGAVLACLMRTAAPLTGRQVHALVADRHSLSTVQHALKQLANLGLIETRVVGRAGVHLVVEEHAAIAPLRSLLDPIDTLTHVALEAAGADVQALVVFGSIARGEAHSGSDVDLAVIAPATWDRRGDLEDAVHIRLGNRCDVVHLTTEDLTRPSDEREPIVAHVLRDGIVLAGSLPAIVGRTAL